MDIDLSTISSTDLHRVKMSQQNENIQVYVRVRPMNNLERSKNSLQVLDCPGIKEVVVKERSSSIHNLTKTFTFDRVFAPKSKQIEVYKAVVAPLLEEVLLGYNCTVFAYGQTGTGKTFTMEGERSNDPDLSWENDPMTGIVPRALSQLFDELRLQNVEFTVRVSLLELYNEELFDLLSPTDDLKMKQLRLFEDSNRKGSVIIQGLEEVTVHNKHEVYSIMERGTEKRRTAATQMNATSSRSHTVFTVTVHIKESNIDGEELIKIGKLHLVDLAGSENIGRSGAVDKRAREAGSINQSLLTLGRVITALVERTPHIPYRESKLTRLLQDSLGGRTKTSIIATVSPASYNLEETLSTLDYAHRAKNIMNRPEINQRLTKKAVMKEFTEEIERLRRDLVATREKNGVYMDKENYDHMIAQLEAQGHDLCEKITQSRALQDTLDKKEEELVLVKAQLEETKDDLAAANQVLNETRARAERLQQELVKTALERDQQEHLVESHVKTEKNLSKEAEILLETTEETTSNLDKLYRKLDRKKYVETCNLESGRRFKADLSEQFSTMCTNLETFRLEHATFCGEQRMKLDEFLQKKETQMASLSNMFTNFIQEMKDYARNSDALVTEEAELSKTQLDDLKLCTEEQRKAAVDNLELSKEQLIKYFSTLYNKFDDIYAKLDSLAAAYGSDIEDQASVVTKFVECSVTQMENAKKDIEVHIENKLAHYLSLQAEFAAYRETNDQYVEELKSEAKGMISEMERWIQNANEYEKKAAKKSDDLLTTVGKEHENDTAFLKRIAKEWDIHRVEADFLRRGYGDNKNSMGDARKKDVKELEDTIENAANTAKFLRGASLEGLAIHLTHLNGMQNAVTHKIDERHLRGIEFANKYFTASTTFIESADKNVKNVISGVEVAFDSDLSHVDEEKKQMETHCNQFSGWSEEARANVLQQSGKLGEFWESTYLTDLPSGQTPQKKSYVYPRNLSATSPHETILERFTTKRREEEKNEIF